MPDIKAFQGLRYSTDRFGHDWTKIVAPPYDVLDAPDKAALLAKDPHNIVAIDLPHVPAKEAGPDSCYEESARLLAEWREAKKILPEPKPALYVYHQEYAYAGKRYTRRKFFARMRLEPFGAGTVFPHEQTFGGPKEDRLKLMQATGAQTSAVFGLYSDPEHDLDFLLDRGDERPNVTAVVEDVQHLMWIEADEQVIDKVSRALSQRGVYIADGHHRYGTALTYRKLQGKIDADHPANFIMVGFCAMEDPGALILPTHRVLSGFGSVKPSEVLAVLQKGVKTRTADPTVHSPEELITDDTKDDLGIYLAAGDRMYASSFTDRSILEKLSAEKSPAWRGLDVAYLHRYLIDELVTNEALGGQAPKIAYIKSAGHAVEVARETNGIALLTRACTMEQLRNVSHAGDLMPQKSTYFYPKLATGLVMNPLK